MFNKKNNYSKEEILACARGELFGKGNPQLPLPNMLMFDRITEISEDGGSRSRGHIIAEFDINKDMWFFGCHFIGDPVMPGCLGLDAMWQLVGFYLGWSGALGRGRARGSGQVKFTGQVTPENKLITYRIDMKRVFNRNIVMGVADGYMDVDGEEVYTVKDLRVGLFASTNEF